MTNMLPTRDLLRVKFDALLNTQRNLTGTEEGNALNAYEFMAGAMRDLQDGDYAGFLCRMDLAGQFARDARKDFYARKDK